MIKVVKFGGSSLASAEQFAKVGKIIHADKERRYVVPSAPGKRNSKDTKVTDMLYACYDLVEKDEDFRVMLMKIKDRYDTIINGLNKFLCINISVFCVSFYELSARRNFVSHQHREDSVGFGSVIYTYLS
jgi:aspartokinase